MHRRILTAAMALAACSPAHADDWQLSVTPYVWTTDVGLGVTLNDRTLVDTTIPFDDLLADLESSVMIRAEAMRGAHGIAADLFDVRLADSGIAALPDRYGDEFEIDARIGMTIFDLAGVYAPGVAGDGLALLYGTRLINQRENLDASILQAGEPGTTFGIDADDTYMDVLLGLRYSGRFGGRWSYELAADVSSGDTQLTWSVTPSVGYRFGERGRYRLSAGYRHMVIDFESGPVLDTDMTLTGTLIGFRFDF